MVSTLDHPDKPSSVPRIEEVGALLAEGPAREVQLEVAHLLNRGRNLVFPGAQPVSFTRQHLAELKRRDYYVCEKSDGIRCLLYFTEALDREWDGPGQRMKEAHYLIDRKNNCYYVESLHFPLAAEPPAKQIDFASYHARTLLDGELLIDTYPDGREVLKYLVFDCLVMDGQDLLSRTLDKRLAYFNEKVYVPYTALCQKFPEDSSGFRFKMEKKSFQLAYGTEMMFKDILPKLKHGSDGLIFTCRETPYKFGTDEHILKWKPAWENTIDFKLELTFPPIEGQNGGDMDGTSENDGGGGAWEYEYDAMPTFTLHVEYGDSRHTKELEYTLHMTPAEWDAMKQHAIEINDGLDGAIVECHREEDGTWHFNRFREDKSTANHYTVVEKVLDSIEDGVTEGELLADAADVRKEWKRRQAEEEEKMRRARDREREREAEEKARRARVEAGKRKTDLDANEGGEKRVRQMDFDSGDVGDESSVKTEE